MVENSTKRPINEVIAENLAYWMQQSEALKTQAALARTAGVAQTTISNYLNPGQRLDGTKGKVPSPKVAELAQIAAALGIEVWHLLRDMSPRERSFYRRVEDAYREAVTSDPDGTTGNTRPGGLDELPTPTAPRKAPARADAKRGRR